MSYNRNGKNTDEIISIVEDTLKGISSVVSGTVNTFVSSIDEAKRTRERPVVNIKLSDKVAKNGYGKGKAGIVVKYVFSSLLYFLSVITALVMLFTFFYNKSIIPSAILTFLFFTGATVLTVSAHSQSRLRTICTRYLPIIGTKPIISIAYLSKVLSKKLSVVYKETELLIKNGMLPPSAYIDRADGMLVLEPDEQETRAEENEQTETDAKCDWALRLRELNDKIADEDVSNRIRLLELYTEKIYDYISTHPDAVGKIRSFENYYLPTTVKLLESYRMIEEVGVVGANMKTTKENIEKTLDALCEAYRNQFDQLYSAEAMDISSDISVLENMLRRDGLSGDDDFGENQTGTME